MSNSKFPNLDGKKSTKSEIRHNGKATLTGNVNFWSERREAGRVASLTEGIWAVDNHLTVEGVDYPWKDWYYSYLDAYSYNYRGDPDYMFYY